MDCQRLLFGFDGRISRAKYWLATLNILCRMIFGLMILAAVSAIFNIGGPLAINLIGISASVQFTDDDVAAKAPLFPQIVTVPMTVLFGCCYAAALLGLVVFICFIWGLVEMYWLKGTRGTNRFGPDPLTPIDTRPSWDQQSELEFVPLSAGPLPGAHVKREA